MRRTIEMFSKLATQLLPAPAPALELSPEQQALAEALTKFGDDLYSLSKGRFSIGPASSGKDDTHIIANVMERDSPLTRIGAARDNEGIKFFVSPRDSISEVVFYRPSESDTDAMRCVLSLGKLGEKQPTLCPQV